MADNEQFGDLGALDRYTTPTMLPPPYRAPGTDYARDALSDFVGGAQGAINYLGNIPKRIMDASEQSRLTGEYDPAPMVEGAEAVLPLGMAAAERGALGALGGKRPPTPPRNPRAVIGGNNPPPQFRMFPEYAEEYPPVGPPTWVADPAKEKKFLAQGLSADDAREAASYWEKTLTPDAEAFKKARTAVTADMAKNGYQPFFDVSKRYPVDPANYPPNVDTLTVIPKKQVTIDKYMKEIGSDEARARLQAAYTRGSQMPNTSGWYRLGQLEDEFIKELGPVAGRQAFQDKIATAMAATTGGADPKSNFLMAMYGNYLRQRGLPVPEHSYEYPFPIGGRYAGTNMNQFQEIFDNGGFSHIGAENPKRHNFGQNLTGNKKAATIDEQMTGIMTPGKTVPPDNTYGLYQQVVNEEAAKAGVDPITFQEVGWAGGKNMKTPKYKSGVPMIQEINDSIERTARLTGLSPQEVLRRGIIRSEIPLYGLAGALGTGALGGLADQSSYATNPPNQGRGFQ